MRSCATRFLRRLYAPGAVTDTSVAHACPPDTGEGLHSGAATGVSISRFRLTLPSATEHLWHTAAQTRLSVFREGW